MKTKETKLRLVNKTPSPRQSQARLRAILDRAARPLKKRRSDELRHGLRRIVVTE